MGHICLGSEICRPIHSMGSLGSSMPDGDLCSEVGPQPNQIWGGDTVWKPARGYNNTGIQSKIGKKRYAPVGCSTPIPTHPK